MPARTREEIVTLVKEMSSNGKINLSNIKFTVNEILDLISVVNESKAAELDLGMHSLVNQDEWNIIKQMLECNIDLKLLHICGHITVQPWKNMPQDLVVYIAEPNTHNVTIDLGGQPQSHESIINLMDVDILEGVTTINLSWCGITNGMLGIILDSLHEFPKITSLNLSGNNQLSSVQLIVLYQTIPNTALRHIDLTDCNATVSDLANIKAALSDPNRKLQQQIFNEQDNVPGLWYYGEAPVELSDSSNQSSLSRLSKLRAGGSNTASPPPHETLSDGSMLWYCGTQSTPLHERAAVLPPMTGEVDLSHIKLTSQMIPVIADAITTNNITSIDFGNAALTAAELAILWTAISQSYALQEFKMNNQPRGDAAQDLLLEIQMKVTNNAQINTCQATQTPTPCGKADNTTVHKDDYEQQKPRVQKQPDQCDKNIVMRIAEDLAKAGITKLDTIKIKIDELHIMVNVLFDNWDIYYLHPEEQYTSQELLQSLERILPYAVHIYATQALVTEHYYACNHIYLVGTTLEMNLPD